MQRVSLAANIALFVSLTGNVAFITLILLVTKAMTVVLFNLVPAGNICQHKWFLCRQITTPAHQATVLQLLRFHVMLWIKQGFSAGALWAPRVHMELFGAMSSPVLMAVFILYVFFKKSVNFLMEQSNMGIECLWKGAINHERLTNTAIKHVFNVVLT